MYIDRLTLSSQLGAQSSALFYGGIMQKVMWILTTMILVGSIPSYSAETAQKSETPALMQKEQTPEQQIKGIDAEIEQLSKQIQKKRMEALNTQIEAQGLLQTQWEAYTQKIIEADRQTDAAKALEQHMHQLQAKKKILVENQYSRKR